MKSKYGKRQTTFTMGIEDKELSKVKPLKRESKMTKIKAILICSIIIIARIIYEVMK